MKRTFGKSRENDNYGNFNRSSSGNRFNQGPRKLHKATCAECGNECEVPFEPKEGRPVYCRDCYSKHGPKRF